MVYGSSIIRPLYLAEEIDFRTRYSSRYPLPSGQSYYSQSIDYWHFMVSFPIFFLKEKIVLLGKLWVSRNGVIGSTSGAELYW